MIGEIIITIIAGLLLGGFFGVFIALLAVALKKRMIAKKSKAAFMNDKQTFNTKSRSFSIEHYGNAGEKGHIDMKKLITESLPEPPKLPAQARPPKIKPKKHKSKTRKWKGITGKR